MSSYQKTWGNGVTKYTKSIVATLTPAVALGTSLGSMLPAEKAVPVTAAVSIVTGFLTWLASNGQLISEAANSAEDLAETTLGRDV